MKVLSIDSVIDQTNFQNYIYAVAETKRKVKYLVEVYVATFHIDNIQEPVQKSQRLSGDLMDKNCADKIRVGQHVIVVGC